MLNKLQANGKQTKPLITQQMLIFSEFTEPITCNFLGPANACFLYSLLGHMINISLLGKP